MNWKVYDKPKSRFIKTAEQMIQVGFLENLNQSKGNLLNIYNHLCQQNK